MKKELMLTSFLAIFIRIVGAFGAFLVTFFIARQVSTEQAGHYFLAFSFITVLSGFSRMGLDNTVLRFCGAGTEQARNIYSFAVIAASLLSLMLSLIIYIGSDFLSYQVFSKPGAAEVLRAIAPGLFGLSLLTLSAMAMQGLRAVALSIFTLSIASNLVLLIAVVALQPDSAKSLGGIYSFSVIGAAIFSSIWVFKNVPVAKSKINYSLIFASSMPLWLESSMSQLVQWSGQFVAGMYVTAEEVATLAVAQRVSMLGSFVLVAVTFVMAPRFAKHHADGEHVAVERLLKFSIVFVSLIASPVFFVMMFYPEGLLGLFGTEYIAGARVLRILALGQIMNAVTGSVAFVLMMSGYEKDMRNITFISGLASILLAFFLTPVLSVTGSAIATSIAVASQNLLAVYAVKKRFGFNALAVWKVNVKKV